MPITKASRNVAGMTGAVVVDLAAAETVARGAMGRSHSAADHAATVAAVEIAARGTIAAVLVTTAADKVAARNGVKTIASSVHPSLHAHARRV